MCTLYKRINGINHFIDIRGIDSNKIIIVIHGGPGGNNYAFQETAGKYLEQSYTMLYYDQRGCGRSERPNNPLDYRLSTLIDDLHQIVMEYRDKEIVLLGYSFGGQLALEYAAKYSDQIDAVVSINPSDFYDMDYHNKTQIDGFKSISSDSFLKFINEQEEIINNDHEVLQLIWNEAPEDIVDKFLFKDERLGKKMRQMWMEGGYENTGLMHQALITDKTGTSIINRLNNIKCNCLLIYGMYDRNCGVKLAKKMVENIQKSHFIVMPNSAHFPDFEETEMVVEHIKEFLSSIDRVYEKS